MEETMYHRLKRHIDPVGMCDSPLETMTGHNYQKAIQDSLSDVIMMPDDSNLIHINSIGKSVETQNIKNTTHLQKILGTNDYAVDTGDELTVLRFLENKGDSIKYNSIFFDKTYILDANSLIEYSEGNSSVKMGEPLIYSKVTDKNYQGNTKEILRAKVNQAINHIVYHNTKIK